MLFFVWVIKHIAWNHFVRDSFDEWKIVPAVSEV
jgi:hypothetical protein